MDSIKITPVTIYSKIVKGALPEVELWMDELTIFGYFKEEPQDFLDKYLHKNEHALKAAGIVTLGKTTANDFRTAEAADHQRGFDTSVATSSLVLPLPTTPVTNSQISETIMGNCDDGEDLEELFDRCNAPGSSANVKQSNQTNQKDGKLSGLIASMVPMVGKKITGAKTHVRIIRAARSEPRGITAKFRHEGREIHLKRIIELPGRILRTSEQKTARLFPGLVIITTCAQQSHKIERKEWIRIIPDERLEILCSQGGNNFNTYNYGQQIPGLVWRCK